MLAGFEALGAVDSMVIGLVHFWLEIIVPRSGTSEMGLTASVPVNFSIVILWWEISFYLVFKSSYPRVSGYRHHKKSYLFNPFMLSWITDVNRCQQSEVWILSNSHLLNMIVYIYKHNWEDNVGTNIW